MGYNFHFGWFWVFTELKTILKMQILQIQLAKVLFLKNEFVDPKVVKICILVISSFLVHINMSLRLMTDRKFCLLSSWLGNPGRNGAGGGVGRDLKWKTKKHTKGVGKYLQNAKPQHVLTLSWFITQIHSSSHWDPWQRATGVCGLFWWQMFYSSDVVKRNRAMAAWSYVFCVK
jgi:hypothetical protein